MRRLITAFVPFVIVLSLGVAYAGVVIDQDLSTVSALDKQPIPLRRLLTIEGNKEKITDSLNFHEFLIDLDANKCYVVHPGNKDYFDMKYPPEASYPVVVLPAALPPLLKYKKTTKTSTVMGLKCNIYSGTGDVRGWAYAVDACYSTQAPGAGEYTAFSKLAAARVSPDDAVPGGAELPDGIPLQLTISSHREAPAPSPGAGAPTPAARSTSAANPAAKESKKPQAASSKQPQAAHVDRTAYTQTITVTKIGQISVAESQFKPPPGFVGKRPRTLGFK